MRSLVTNILIRPLFVGNSWLSLLLFKIKVLKTPPITQDCEEYWGGTKMCSDLHLQWGRQRGLMWSADQITTGDKPTAPKRVRWRKNVLLSSVSYVYGELEDDF